MNMADTNPLIGVDGRPRYGVYSTPLSPLNLEDFRPHGMKVRESFTKRWVLKHRIKQWEYVGLMNSDIIFGMAIIRLGYMCNFFAYLFDRRSSRITEYQMLSPGGGAARFEGTSQAGNMTFKKAKTSIRVSGDSQTLAVEGSADGELFVNLSFQKQANPLVCLTRTGLKGFNYTHKEAGIPVHGTLRCKDKSWEIEEGRSFGVRDFTLGFLARQTFWNWASGGGLDRDGNRIGFNLVQGVNETGFTENGFWVNGRLVKIDVVDFRYDDLNILKPWHIESNDGRVRLRFLPEGERSANINKGLIVSKFHQPFGRFEGTLRDGDHTRQLQDVSGFTEEHYAKW
jgi:hypothetical protein